jgi:hypothetical protein
VAGSLVASYDERHDQTHARRFQLLSSLTDALNAPDQFSLVYQVRVDIGSGQCFARPHAVADMTPWLLD